MNKHSHSGVRYRFLKSILVFSCLTLFGSTSSNLPLANASNTFVIEPYFYVTSTTGQNQGVEIAWQYSRTFQNHSGIVELRRDGRVYSKVQAVMKEGVYHALLPQVCGMGHSISYYVTGMTGSKSLFSPPCAGSKENARFAFISDTQMFPKNTVKTISQLARFDVPVIIHGGDIVQRGTDYKEWEQQFSAMNEATQNRILVPAVGNHEYWFDDSVPAWQKYFSAKAGNWFMTYELGPVRLFVFNSAFEDNPNLIKGEQLAWLEHELSRPAKWKIVVMHHPPYSSGIAQVQLAPAKEHLFLREFYVPLLEKYGVQAVLSGHTHVYERAFKSGINYIVAGPAGGVIGMIGAKNPYSYFAWGVRTASIFDISEHDFYMATIDDEGRQIDRLTLHR